VSDVAAVVDRGAALAPRAPAVVLWQARALVAGTLLAAVGVAALLRFWAIGRQGFWYDEAVTAWLLTGSPRQMLAAVPITESTPPLYYVLAWGWSRVFGMGDAAVRSLSAVAGVAAVPAAFAAGRALVGMRAGLVAAVLVAVNPLLVWYSQEARAYSLLVLLTAAGLWAFARAREERTLGTLVAWGVLSALALCTHYFAAFAIAPEAALLLADRRTPLSPRLLAIGIVCAAAAGLAGVLARQAGEHILYFTHTSILHRTSEIVHQYLVGFRPPASQGAFIVAAAVVVAAAVLLALRADPPERRGALLAASVCAGAAATPVLLALAGHDYLDTRNVIAGVVPMTVVLAAGLGARRAGTAGFAAAAALVVVSVTMVVATARDPWAQRGPWREVAAALRWEPGRPHRAILVRGSGSWGRVIAHYLPATWWLKPRGARVSDIEVLRRLPSPRACIGRSWWGAICDTKLLPRLRSAPARGFRLVAVRRVAGFEIARYRAARPVLLRPLPGRPRYERFLITPTREPALPS
jgi:hypothetical protein